ncbi:hypothetical protein JCM10212_006697 [Sporobolomyces blumeae]
MAEPIAPSETATPPPPIAVASSSQPSSSAKRRAAPLKPPSKKSNSTKPAKRARVKVEDHETTQVKTLEQYRLPFVDGDVFYCDDFVDPETAQAWHDELVNVDGWYQPTLKMYGKEITQSRKIAAFATDPALTVKYSGALVDMRYEYPPLLRKIQDMVENKLGVVFNHVMCNRYEDGAVYIGNHRDNRENRVIASLSLGAPRTFIMEHDSPPASAPASSKKPTRPLKRSKTEPVGDDRSLVERPGTSSSTTRGEVQHDALYYKKWTLANGSLVVMQGDTQLKWKHQIPKEPKVRASRISLTFRQLVF